MNQQIDNALGGYEESVATVGGGSNSQDTGAGNPAKPAPDTLLEQVKKLRPKVTQGDWRTTQTYQDEVRDVPRFNGVQLGRLGGFALHHEMPNRSEIAQFIALSPQMADLCISQAARIEELEDALKRIIEEHKALEE